MSWRDRLTENLLERLWGIKRLKDENRRLGEALAAERQRTSFDGQWELDLLRERIKDLTPQKQFRVLAKGPCLPGTSQREVRFLDITSVQSGAGEATVISVDAPWLTPSA